MKHPFPSSLCARTPSQVIAATLLLISCEPRTLGSYAHENHVQDSSVGAADADTPLEPVDGGPELPKLDAASASDAAPPPPLACARDADCSDGDPCTGSERCVDNSCVDGTSPCLNPDAEHCNVSCRSAGGEVECSVVAPDRDGDQHLDRACAQASVRGDDCDDADPQTHPDAAERCDGLDNNCNDQLDLSDGLLTVAQPSVFGVGTEHGIAASNEGTFAVVYVAEEQIWARVLDANGTDVGERVLVSDTGNTLSTAITWGHDAFGISWSSQPRIGFRRMSARGELLGATVNVGPDFSLFSRSHPVRVGSSDWLVLFACCRSRPTLYGRRIDPDGMLLDPLYTIASQDGSLLTGVAVSGEQLGMTWWRAEQTEPGTHFVEWTRRTAQLTKADDVAPSITSGLPPERVKYPVIAPTPSGYAIAWSKQSGPDTTSLQYAEFDHQGSKLCGDIALGSWTTSGGLGDLFPRTMVGTPKGYAVILDAPDLERPGRFLIDVVEVRPNCQYAQRFRLASSGAFPETTIARSSDGHYRVLWQDDVNGVYNTLMQTRLGANFCD